MLKVGRIFQIPEYRNAVNAGFSLGGARRTKLRRAQRADTEAEAEYMPAGER
jgi:hypothetical protein